MAQAAQAQEEDDFDDTPEGLAKRWEKEMTAADEFLKDFRKQADESLKAYLDIRKDVSGGSPRSRSKLNLYWRNLQVQRALLYGKTPSVEVSRKFGDANDNVARLAGELQERALNCDIARDGEDGYATVMGAALDDRLPVGMGQARVRYVVEHETKPGKPAMQGENGEELAEAVPETQVKKSEDVEVDYIHWRDFAYSPCRVWSECRWVGFRNEMRQAGLMKRFVESLMRLTQEDEASCRMLVKQIPMDAKKADSGTTKPGDELDARSKDPWDRAEVWEIWDLDTERVYWWVKGFRFVLDVQENPYNLRGFFPCPRPMLSNVSNDSLVAKSDYFMLRDLYGEADALYRRITILQRVIRAAGLYDKTAGDIGRLLSEGAENELIPIEAWNRWAEKGGVAGQIDWLPLEPIINALAILRDQLTATMALIDQISGMSDIVRGEASVQSATATEQGIKAKYASVRMAALQDEFARFCSDVQRLKGELMANFYSPDTYIQKSNLQHTFDATDSAQDIQQAIALLKSKYADYRVEVKSDQIAMQDFAQMKTERTEVISGIAQFLSSAQPLLQAIPGSSGFLGELLRWYVSGIRGSRSIEGELDKVLAQAEQAQKAAAANPRPPPPPDPKVQAQQMKTQSDAMKAQADMQKEQFKLQANLATINAQTTAKDKEEQSQAYWNTEEARAKRLIEGPRLVQSPSPAQHPGWTP